jgi:hypothetical protein
MTKLLGVKQGRRLCAARAQPHQPFVLSWRSIA